MDNVHKEYKTKSNIRTFIVKFKTLKQFCIGTRVVLTKGKACLISSVMRIAI
jgi:hypothetical protein